MFRQRPAKAAHPLRVRHEPPTIAEAFSAARELADDLEAQIEIASGLMGVPADEARHYAMAQGRRRTASVEYRGPRQVRRTVVVERRRRPSFG